MTRINCVPVEQLSRQHLVAEYRELPRIFGMVRGLVERGITCPKRADIPSTYRMGTGHMKFFIDKLGWLVQRQKLLILEMQRRGYAPQHTDPESLLDGIPVAFHGPWSPTNKDLEISWARTAALAMWLAVKEIEGIQMSNAPRYRLVGYDIGTAPDENGGWVHWTDHEAEIARLTAERDAAMAGAVKAKPDPDAHQAALAKAFCMGRDMAAETCWSVKDESDYRYWGGDANAHAVRINLTGKQRSIRALLPPADLAAKIGGE